MGFSLCAGKFKVMTQQSLLDELTIERVGECPKGSMNRADFKVDYTLASKLPTLHLCESCMSSATPLNLIEKVTRVARS